LLILLSLTFAAARPRIPQNVREAAHLISNLRMGGPKPNTGCILKNCKMAMARCALNKDCRSALSCTAGCGKGGPTNQTCIFQCTSDFENDVYDDLIKCFFTDHNCMQDPGTNFSKWEMCRSTKTQATPLKTYLGKALTQAKAQTLLTRNGKDDGYWLVAKGLSHAYDCFDCQNLYFNRSVVNDTQLHYSAIYKIHKSDGNIRWNDAEYEADWNMFPEPGRMHLHAPDYGGLVHDEDWRILAVDERTPDDPQWMALYYCGGAPGVLEAYEGSCVMTPNGLVPSDKKEVAKIEAAYTRAGITLACTPNNSAAACKGHPTPRK
jgi:hypothetical protein